MKKNKVTEFDGCGTFTSPTSMAVALNDGSTDQLTFDNAIIATGAVTRLLPGVTLSPNVVTYEEQILDANLPGSIVIVGAGAIGMEFAYVLKNYGVDVTIVEFLDRALPNEDAEVSKEIAKQYKKLGVKILARHQGRGRRRQRLGRAVTVSPRGRRRPAGLKADKVLSSIGFAPRVEGYGLETTGVALTDRGAIAIDDYMRTNVPQHLRHRRRHREAAARARRRGAGRRRRRDHRRRRDDALGDYRMMPRATFCQPQVASFGSPRQQARDEGYDVKVAKFPFTANGKAHGLGEPSASSSSSPTPSTSSCSAAT